MLGILFNVCRSNCRSTQRVIVGTLRVKGAQQGKGAGCTKLVLIAAVRRQLACRVNQERKVGASQMSGAFEGLRV